jgi:two-component system, NarL family, sensor kinase
MAGRLPIESNRPVVIFAAVRLALAIGSLLLTVILGFPYHGRLAATLAIGGVPWSAAIFWLARRSPGAAQHPLVAVGDFGLLLAVELLVPETYGAVRFAALLFVAVHADFQGEIRGLAVAVGGGGTLIVGSVLRGDAPVHGDTLTFYETAFGVAAIATGLLVGRLRTTESASRLRARRLTRRTMEAEREVRRRIAEAIHDGPVQELIGLDMVLSAAHQAAGDGDSAKVEGLIAEARELTTRNVQALRDEIVDLGPYAFEELTFDVAIGNCISVWERRYGFEVLLTIEEMELPAEIAADLFAITQEAVANAGRHAKARSVTISLRRVEADVELRVMDDGQGFAGADPLGPSEPGHLGLASMRERTELLDGDLAIESSDRGTKLVLRAPLGRRRSVRTRRLGTRD